MVDIVLCEKRHVDDCLEALIFSEVGQTYFRDISKTKEMLFNAVDKKEVYAALNRDGECMGFIYFMPKGVFGSYPYLHIISVKEKYRGQGIGQQLIYYFEQHASNFLTTKCFLTVDDFNMKAQALYERLGYRCVGVLPDFYRQGIACNVMMKEVIKIQ